MTPIRMAMAALMLIIADTGHAALPCSYAAYKPGSMRYFLAQQFALEGIAAVPATFFAGSDADADEWILAEASGPATIRGYMTYEKSLGNGTERLVFLDVQRQPLGVAEEIITPCSTGLCRESKFTISVRGIPSTLRVSYRPGYRLTHYIGRNEAPYVSLWRSEFDEHIQFLAAQLVNSPHVAYMAVPAREQALATYLALDPDILPYLPLLTLSRDRNGRPVLSGRTNHAIYNLIIDTALARGFYDIIPQVIIDSGVVMGNILPTDDLRRCQ